MKGLNEIIKEAFFDDHLEGKDAPVRAAIEGWLNKHCQEDAQNIQINDDMTLSTSWVCIFLDVDEQIPEYIRFKKCNSLMIYGEIESSPIKLHKDLLPPSMKRMNINASGVEFDDKIKLDVDELTISHAQTISLSKKMSIRKLSVTDCKSLEKLENLQGAKYINIPNAFAATLFRKAYNYKGDLSMNGFGPY